MGFQCGIVGLPNVGKSTIFNALTSAAIQAENYPFCTIKCSRVDRKNEAREIFSFGAKSEKFTNDRDRKSVV